MAKESAFCEAIETEPKGAIEVTAESLTWGVEEGMPEGFKFIPSASLFWGLFVIWRLFGRVVVAEESEYLGDEGETPVGREYKGDVVTQVLWVSKRFSLCKVDIELGVSALI